MDKRNRYADGEAIKAARQFDPTQPVYASGYDNFGGYYQWLDDGTALNDSSWPKTYYSLATKNPVSILNLKNDRAISRDSSEVLMSTIKFMVLKTSVSTLLQVLM